MMVRPWIALLVFAIIAGCGDQATGTGPDGIGWEVLLPDQDTPPEVSDEVPPRDLSLPDPPEDPVSETGVPELPSQDLPGEDPGAADTPADPGSDPATTDPGSPDLPTVPDLPGTPDLLSDSGPVPSWQGLYDPTFIRDASTAQCAFQESGTTRKDGVLVRVFRVSYLSWEYRDGRLLPIRIRGYAARPATGNGRLPGIVQAHGLGGMAEESHATGTAALTGAFVLAYTGPGGGDKPENTSEGLPAGDREGYRMFDTLEDPRGSWFWAHTVAALRGLTCLADHPEVDPDRLGMTGFSAGGVASLMGAGADDRIRAAVPLSASGAWDEAVRSPNAWQHTLLARAGLTIESPEWTRLIEELDSARHLPKTRALVLMVNGSADEFFPLTAHRKTYDAIPGTEKRTALVGNFDHGCFEIVGVEPKEDIQVRAQRAAAGGQWFWFHHAFGSDPRCTVVPEAPSPATFTSAAGLFLAGAMVDPGGSSLKVVEVRLWLSEDGKVWVSRRMEDQGNHLYMTPLSEAFPWDPAGLVSYVDVLYSTKDLIGARQFSLSSRPVFPESFIPSIRSIQNCL